MNELSKYKYVANDFNDLCNIIGEIEEITLNHAVDFVTQPTQHFGIGDSAIYNGHWFLVYKDLNGYLQKVYYVTHFIMVPASLAVLTYLKVHMISGYQ